MFAWVTFRKRANYLVELKEHGTQKDEVDGGKT